MDIVIIITLILIVGVVFLLLQNKRSVSPRDTALKKEDIISNYENDLKKILSKYENNKEKQIEEKKLFLQNCSSELSRNIFFTPDEAKQIIQKLALL